MELHGVHGQSELLADLAVRLSRSSEAKDVQLAGREILEIHRRAARRGCIKLHALDASHGATGNHPTLGRHS